MKFNKFLLALFAITTVFFVNTNNVLAQSKEDPIAAAIRVDQLERRLSIMEQKLFASNPTAKGHTSDGAVFSNNAKTVLADLEARLAGLEEEWQKLYGGMEELSHSVEKLAENMNVISKDLDMRLQDLEKIAANNGRMEQKKSEDPVNPDEEEKEPTAVRKSAQPVTENIPLDISAEEMYKKAYAYLTAASYDKARLWFNTFLERFGQDTLADNAYYWLGEIHLVESSPEDAVIAFSKGLATFPKGAKAPANMLKLGVAFQQMGRNDHAKASWKKLVADYPESAEAEKAKVKLGALE